MTLTNIQKRTKIEGAKILKFDLQKCTCNAQNVGYGFCIYNIIVTDCEQFITTILLLSVDVS